MCLQNTFWCCFRIYEFKQVMGRKTICYSLKSFIFPYKKYFLALCWTADKQKPANKKLFHQTQSCVCTCCILHSILLYFLCLDKIWSCSSSVLRHLRPKRATCHRKLKLYSRDWSVLKSWLYKILTKQF